MNIVTLLQPPRIVIGDGCAPQCAEFLAQRGVHRVLLVSSTPVLPTLGGVLEALQQAGRRRRASRRRLIANRPAPCSSRCSPSRARKTSKPSSASAAAARLTSPNSSPHSRTEQQSVAEVFGINLLASRALPLVCLPTTAGTGAEVSPNAILLDEADELKKGVVSPHLVPDAAFIDPLLTLTVPPAVTAATGLDALTHCIEAFANKFAHPVVDVYALQGIRLIAANLERAVREWPGP